MSSAPTQSRHRKERKRVQFSHVRAPFPVDVCDPWCLPRRGIRTLLLVIVTIVPVEFCLAFSPTSVVALAHLPFALVPFPLPRVILAIMVVIMVLRTVVIQSKRNEIAIILERGFLDDSHWGLWSARRDGRGGSRALAFALALFLRFRRSGEGYV